MSRTSPVSTAARYGCMLVRSIEMGNLTDGKRSRRADCGELQVTGTNDALGSLPTVYVRKWLTVNCLVTEAFRSPDVFSSLTDERKLTSPPSDLSIWSSAISLCWHFRLSLHHDRVKLCCTHRPLRRTRSLHRRLARSGEISYTSSLFPHVYRVDVGPLGDWVLVTQLHLKHANSIHRALQSTEYKLSNRNYKAQYAQMYYARLMELSPQVRKQAMERWPSMPGAVRTGYCKLVHGSASTRMPSYVAEGQNMIILR